MSKTNLWDDNKFDDLQTYQEKCFMCMIMARTRSFSTDVQCVDFGHMLYVPDGTLQMGICVIFVSENKVIYFVIEIYNKVLNFFTL